jgi:Glyoxalase/Bleomycin resistance protein/Dioxygenase superfamily
LLGLRWRSLRETVLSVRIDGQLRNADLLVTYSMTGPPYIELIEDRSGDTWAIQALALSHIGFWAKDLATAAARLESSGLAARVHDNGDGDGRPSRFTYHPGLGGMWVELVAPGFAQSLQDWMVSTLADDPTA